MAKFVSVTAIGSGKGFTSSTFLHSTSGGSRKPFRLTQANSSYFAMAAVYRKCLYRSQNVHLITMPWSLAMTFTFGIGTRLLLAWGAAKSFDSWSDWGTEEGRSCAAGAGGEAVKGWMAAVVTGELVAGEVEEDPATGTGCPVSW